MYFLMMHCSIGGTKRERNGNKPRPICARRIAAMQKNMERTENPALIPPQLGRKLWAQSERLLDRRLEMTDSETRAAALVVMAIHETIVECGDKGAPLGLMYAALCGQISYDTFTGVISALVKARVIRVSNHCAYPVKVS